MTYLENSTVIEMDRGLINEKYGELFQKHLLEQYKLYVNTSTEVTAKRLETNKFFLTLNSIMFGSTSYISTQHIALTVILFSLTGLLISFAWLKNILAYKELNRAKFKVIHELETHLPASLFRTEEKHYLERYHGLTSIEIICPIAFLVLYIALIILAGANAL